jgi:hypothetical protein
MADYVVNITAKDNISGTLKQISQDFDNIGNTARESAKEIGKTDKELGHLGESSKVLDYTRQRFEKITQSTAPAKKQLREL